MRGRDASCAERLGENVGGGNCVLHRKIDADAADRRHGVRGIADAEQAWPVPLRSSRAQRRKTGSCWAWGL